MKRVNTYLLPLLSLLLTNPACMAADEKPLQYQVEMMLYQNTQASDTEINNNLYTLQRFFPPKADTHLVQPPESSSEAAEATSVTTNPPEHVQTLLPDSIELLPSDHFLLQTIATRLQKDDSYKERLHLAWMQAIEKGRSITVSYDSNHPTATSTDPSPLFPDSVRDPVQKSSAQAESTQNQFQSQNPSTAPSTSFPAPNGEPPHESGDQTSSTAPSTPSPVQNGELPHESGDQKLSAQAEATQTPPPYHIQAYITLTMHNYIDMHIQLMITENDTLHSYYVDEKRRLRLNQLNYIDHPLFATLVEVFKPLRPTQQGK